MQKLNRKWFCVIVLVLMAYIVKNIFVGVDNDETYGIVLGYRLAMGDKLLLEMWEPHQTSAIFTAFFIKLFLWISGGSITWLNIYLRIVYFVFHSLIAYGVYRTFRCCFSDAEKESAKWMGLIYFVSSPKCIYIPEYSNLHIWFFSLLCLSFMWYYDSETLMRGRKSILFLGGIFLACDVLAYPSMVLLYPVCILLMWIKRRGKFWKEVFIFTIPCILGALILIGYISSYMSWGQIVQVMPYIMGDGSHSASATEKWMDVLLSFGEMAIFLVAGAAIAGLFTAGYYVLCSKKGQRRGKKIFFLNAWFIVLAIHQVYCWFTSEFNASYPHVIYLYICIVGIYFYYKIGCNKKTGFYLILFSIIGYIGIILMSNWEPIHLIPYLIMGVLGGLFYWSSFLTERYQWGKRVFRIFCGIIVFSNIFGYCYLIIGGADVHSSIFTVSGYNREGVRKGILAEYMSAYCYNSNQEIWSEAIPEGSAVLYIGPNPVFYMQGNCVIASGSTISTPTYDESLLAYWELHPERVPDVVVFESMWGEIRVVKPDSFIMQWVQKEFQAKEVEEYPYVTVYKR